VPLGGLAPVRSPKRQEHSNGGICWHLRKNGYEHAEGHHLQEEKKRKSHTGTSQ